MKVILLTLILVSTLFSAVVQNNGESLLQIFAQKNPQSTVVSIVSLRDGKVIRDRCFNTRDYGRWCKIIYNKNGLTITGYSDEKSLNIIASQVNTNPTFETSFGGRYSDIGYAILPQKDSILLVGATQSYGKGQDDVYVIKVDNFGNKLASGVYGGTGIDIAKSIVEVDDGFMLGGTTRSLGNKTQSLYFAKISKELKLKFQKGYYSDKDDYYAGNDMIAIGNNNFIVAGYEDHVEFFDSEINGYINAINEDGIRNGIKRYGGNKVDKINSIISVKDGYVFAGETNSRTHGEKDCYVVKLNKDGDVIWNKVYGWRYNEIAKQVIATVDGGYIIVGYTDSDHSKQKDAFVLKLDRDGNKMWQYHYGSKENDEGYGIVEVNDGYVFAGYTNDTRSYNSDIYLVKISKTGNIIWHKNYGGDAEDKAYAIAKVKDGFVITGYITSKANFSKDLYLLKVDENGELN